MCCGLAGARSSSEEKSGGESVVVLWFGYSKDGRGGDDAASIFAVICLYLCNQDYSLD